MVTELSSEDTFTLTEIGYASVMYGVPADVKPIFEALQMLYPDNTAGAIGNAIVALNRGDYDTAISSLQNCLQQCQTNTDEARAILMLAMHLAGRDAEAEQLAEKVEEENGIANSMAQSLFTENQQS
jgi:lipopolysaccharide biosynthesis regulator YciM